MRLIDQLTHPPSNLGECHKIMKHVAHDNARLRSMLFQFLDGGDCPGFRAKVADLLGIINLKTPTRITDDPMFNSLNDED